MPYHGSGGKQCAVTNCKNNQKMLYEWNNSPCKLHPELNGKDCPCIVPFKFHCIPKSGELRIRWLESINRKNFNPSFKAVVCSRHFIDGRPTKRNPVPDLEIGNQPNVASSSKPSRQVLNRHLKTSGNISHTKLDRNPRIPVFKCAKDASQVISQEDIDFAPSVKYGIGSSLRSDQLQRSASVKNAIGVVSKEDINFATPVKCENDEIFQRENPFSSELTKETSQILGLKDMDFAVSVKCEVSEYEIPPSSVLAKEIVSQVASHKNMDFGTSETSDKLQSEKSPKYASIPNVSKVVRYEDMIFANLVIKKEVDESFVNEHYDSFCSEKYRTERKSFDNLMINSTHSIGLVALDHNYCICRING